jgi:hypothetical protein
MRRVILEPRDVDHDAPRVFVCPGCALILIVRVPTGVVDARKGASRERSDILVVAHMG